MINRKESCISDLEIMFADINKNKTVYSPLYKIIQSNINGYLLYFKPGNLRKDLTLALEDLFNDIFWCYVCSNHDKDYEFKFIEKENLTLSEFINLKQNNKKILTYSEFVKMFADYTFNIR